ncbi:AsnC family protein [Streptomyces sp. NPDC058307]|uniref:AsnC family protein n=1 Tax=Streptomyces sp. NPDC058307 TaxID=3346439 RepID=UPI0036EFE1F9
MPRAPVGRRPTPPREPAPHHPPGRQTARLTADRPPAPTGPFQAPTAEDTPLLDALAEDGRTTHTRLAELAGWSKARVARRLDVPESSGARSPPTSTCSRSGWVTA